jgi:threonylcarbamoyladenosine tRNA methylthiotransferase CDKAL1
MQAGSNDVLKHMLRGNTNEEFLQYVKELKDTVPRVTLATDVIVGYPTETEQDYWETLNTIRETSPDAVNISKFWPRSKTPAAKLKPIQGDEVKRRSKVLTDVFHNISKLQNEKWVNWRGSIIIDEKGKEESQWIGRNDSYKQIIVQGDFLIGEILNVKVEKAEIFGLRAKVL